MTTSEPSGSSRGEEPDAEIERLRALIRDFPGVIYLQEADSTVQGPGRFLYVSPAIERILGYTAEEWLAEPHAWVAHLHPDDVPAMRVAREAVGHSGEPYRADYRVLAQDGRVVWIHDESNLIRDQRGAPLHRQGVMYDVTERPVAPEHLPEAERRYRALVELERALKREREEAAELRAIDELKTTFLQAVSHDLRTPLAAILGLSVTLEKQEDLGASEARDLASRISLNARKLDRIVTDLLDLDRISRGILKPNLRATDLEELVRRVVGESDLLGGRSVELELDPVTIEVDAGKIERIVENLISNAVRHTPPGCKIWVRAGPEAGGALLIVEDDGPGVPPEHREDIFQPFRQGAGGPQHSPGVGIGLAVVSRFAEMHGGRTWVQDRVGGGASFRVFLPGDRFRGTAA